MNNILINDAIDTANYLKQYFKSVIPDTVVILGTGLGSFTQLTKVVESIKYTDIPNFPQSYVVGHKGHLTIAEVDNGRRILLMEGRFHYYEGYTPQQVTFPIAVFHQIGVKNIIISNAAGGINPNFEIGDLMLITDHINFFGNHPLIGKNNDALGPRFLDQTEPYNNHLINLALSVAKELNIQVRQGIYIGLNGPTYESKAEIKAFANLGADAVGMSTVFEVIMANYFKMKVLGISCITNMATGISKDKHDHVEIINRGKMVREKFSNLVNQIIKQM
ncbi:MAG: purine-nucleoside phosphorylase [Burkholderiales bacterium]|nr:purine-nucleoside phosphorylase [Burkholderiales bacterium]